LIKRKGKMKIKKNYYSIIICLMLFVFVNQSTFSQVVEQGSLALVALYNSINGVNWINNANWLTGQVFTWYGITVFEKYATEVKLCSNNLVETIPTNSQILFLWKLVIW
jgi:hypothetical protein